MHLSAGDAQVGLLGRARELAALDRAQATARAGRSAVLVLRGEAGIGETALLDYVAGRAAGSVPSTSPASKRRWNSRSRACTSCAHPC